MFVGKTMDGLEEIAADEANGKKVCARTIEFVKKKELKTVSMVYEKRGVFKFDSLDDIGKRAREVKMQVQSPVAVKGFRVGNHEFKSVDAAQEVAVALREKGVVVDYKNPKEVVVVDIIDDVCIMGMLVKEDMCKREYRVKVNNKSVSACIAAAMVRIAGVKMKESVLDPLCKDGVIAIEAWMSGIKKVYASDVVANNVRNASVNCRFGKIKIIPECHEVREISKKYKQVDHIITNMVLSKNDKGAENLFAEMFAQAKNVVKKRVTIITNHPELVDGEKAGFGRGKRIEVKVGDMQYAIMTFDRVKEGRKRQSQKVLVPRRK